MAIPPASATIYFEIAAALRFQSRFRRLDSARSWTAVLSLAPGPCHRQGKLQQRRHRPGPPRHQPGSCRQRHHRLAFQCRSARHHRAGLGEQSPSPATPTIWGLFALSDIAHDMPQAARSICCWAAAMIFSMRAASIRVCCLMSRLRAATMAVASVGRLACPGRVAGALIHMSRMPSHRRWKSGRAGRFPLSFWPRAAGFPIRRWTRRA